MNAIPLPDDFGLRPLRADDAPDIFTAIDTQREHLGRWLPFVAATHRVEQTREVVAAMLADPANPVFTLRVGDAFAGLIGFKSADSTTLTIEIGYWLRSEYQGRGLMTSAVEALCRTAFGQMGMENVEIKCAAGNLRSNRIPLRLGFRLDRIEVRASSSPTGSSPTSTYTGCHAPETKKPGRRFLPVPTPDNTPALPAQPRPSPGQGRHTGTTLP